MKTEEIVKLSRKVLAGLFRSHGAIAVHEELPAQAERRRAPRWPFPAQIEVRPAGKDDVLPNFFDCRDLSETGMGMSGDCLYPINSQIDLSIHLPEITLYGRAVVRYCLRTPRGHMMGVEFLFDD